MSCLVDKQAKQSQKVPLKKKYIKTILLKTKTVEFILLQK
jgi:hypothetical protein